MLNRLGSYLLAMGIPGLLLISFIDSAAIPLTGGPDGLIMLLSWSDPAMAPLIVLAATTGSLLGCLVLYGIGQKGGEKTLSRFHPARIARIQRRMQAHGFWAILLAAFAPPPFPTKVIVLAAGVFKAGKVRLTMGVSLGRLIRYSILAYLAVRFGDRAAEIIKARYPVIFLVLLVCVAAAWLAGRITRKRAEVS